MASIGDLPTHESSGNKKTVYLIRHAESEENRRIASLGRCFTNVGKFSLPSRSDIYASSQLLNVMAQIDSNVSAIGIKQIADMNEKLNEVNFLQTEKIQLVAHSPLLRAQETSEGMLGCRAKIAKSKPVDRVEELDLLLEKTIQEWTPLYFSNFKARISSFEDWLDKQPENRIAIVGHSQYFKAMLGLDFKFGNCDVWQVTFDHSKRTSLLTGAEVVPKEGTPPVPAFPQWSNLKHLHKCDVHPVSQDI